jgi:C-terminal processing protease CtpA/Prc
LGTEFHKNGPGKNDFKEEKSEIYPAKDAETFLEKPLLILTNRGCYSATNMFAAFMKGLKNVKLIGGKTGGGGGLPTATELSNGWILRVSGSITLDRNGFNIENGVEPDIKINMSKADMDRGKDTILEEGLKVIRQN